MSNEEVRKAIDELNYKLSKELNNVDFTLNDKINIILEEKSKIRRQCNHSFKDGSCIWCDEIGVIE